MMLAQQDPLNHVSDGTGNELVQNEDQRARRDPHKFTPATSFPGGNDSLDELLRSDRLPQRQT